MPLGSASLWNQTLLMMRKIGYCLTIFGLIGNIALAQYTITGKVVDQTNQQPLKGANVQLKGSYQGTVTNQKGRFKLSGVKGGRRSLIISYLGYQTDTTRLNLGSDQQIAVNLRPKTYLEEAVLVQSTRADRGTPTTYTNVDKATLEAENTGRNMPALLANQPSVVSSSNGGMDIGYTDMRIRGVSQSRINVTINGIPLNDAESQGVFWVNIPDIAAVSESIQIQRGVGTSTNGAAAFGATVNLETSGFRKDPFVQLNNSYGSFHTMRNNIRFGTGLLDNNWSFQGSFSRIQSDGYIDRATSDLKSYYLSGGYYGEKTILKALAFGGRERTYQAWYGVPERKMGRFANGQQYLGDLAAPLQRLFGNDPETDKGDRTYNFYDYENQVDDYGQDHYQVHLSQVLSEAVTGNVALHYTYGRGFFEQFREQASLPLHQVEPVKVGDSTIKQTDLVRRRWLDNHFYGGTFSLNYDGEQRWKATVGGAWNRYVGDHFGKLRWARFAGNSEIGDKFYDNTGTKRDFNIYGKLNYRFNAALSGFVDLQYRNVHYEVAGQDLGQKPLAVTDNLGFFNPKIGLDYRYNSRNSFYVFFGIGNREPTRNDYIDAPKDQPPQHESLYNAEAGYQYQGRKTNLKVNAYYMRYRNQLVNTGAVNDVGANIRTNVDHSYRAGLEVIGAYQFAEKWQWQGNATFSRNRILNTDYKVGGELVKSFESTPIALSPSVVAASQFQYQPLNGFQASIQSKYVGEQYLDNTGSSDRKIKDYLLNNLRLSYTINGWELFEEITARVEVNNLLNVRYANDGYTFATRTENGEVNNFNFFYPQAGRNYMAAIKLGF